MKHILFHGLALMLVIVTVTGCSTAPTIDETLEAVEAIGEPDFDPARKQEPGYLENYKREQHELYRQKAAMLLQACRAHPDDDRVPELMNKRWVLLGWNQDPKDVANELIADLGEVLRTETNPDVIRHGVYWSAYYHLRTIPGPPEMLTKMVTDFADKYPDDERGAELLDMMAEHQSTNDLIRTEIYRRLTADYPDTHYGIFAPGKLRCLKEIGQPFELTFNDVTSGRAVDLDKMRGKVVVIDFWSTTCMPCVEELPVLKEIYSNYHQHGVELVGISLDEPEGQGGKQALLKFLDEHEIPWPQYYQGNGFNSEFSKSWGVGGIPAMFVIDKDGRLYTSEGRGELVEIIDVLL